MLCSNVNYLARGFCIHSFKTSANFHDFQQNAYEGRAVFSFLNPGVFVVIAKLQKAEIRLCPFPEPPNSGDALAPPAPPLNTALNGNQRRLLFCQKVGGQLPPPPPVTPLVTKVPMAVKVPIAQNVILVVLAIVAQLIKF